jgi:hypothetical protein
MGAGIPFVVRTGTLLGSVSGGVLEVTNCFGVPFHESPDTAEVWDLVSGSGAAGSVEALFTIGVDFACTGLL